MSNNINERSLSLLAKESVGLSDNITVQLLAGDASSRKYYRVADECHSAVIVVSEPYSLDDPSISSNYAFKKLGAPVPAIIKLFPDKGIMIKEDLGSVHLQNITNPKELVDYYDKVIEVMLAYQLNGAASTDRLYPLSYSFTKEKFISELNLTSEYYIRAYKQHVLKGSEQAELESVFNEIIDELMMQKTLLLHRDYHSRNIMINKNKIYVIDYQDARLGPYSYDLASLVIDPYIRLDKMIIDRAISSYYDGVKDHIKETFLEFKRAYNLCFLQRGIKILGTFAYQKVAKDNDRYLEYIRPSEQKVQNVLKVFPEWRDVLVGALFK